MVLALVEGGERGVVPDNLTTGFDWAAAPGAALVIGDTGDQSRVGASNSIRSKFALNQ
jgi:UDP-glucose 4-epimerase